MQCERERVEIQSIWRVWFRAAIICCCVFFFSRTDWKLLFACLQSHLSVFVCAADFPVYVCVSFYQFYIWELSLCASKCYLSIAVVIFFSLIAILYSFLSSTSATHWFFQRKKPFFTESIFAAFSVASFSEKHIQKIRSEITSCTT